MRLLCPNHNDTTPSLHVYPEWSHCFVCGYRCPTDKLDVNYTPVVNRATPQDVESRLAYIKNLPIVHTRGLRLPADTLGYYIVWPNAQYYKHRLYNGKRRYMGPAGIRAPLLEYKPVSTIPDTIVLVEGEINALSLKAAYTDHNLVIASPGSCAEFERHYNTYLSYKRICIIVDYDNPGVGHGYVLKQRLMKDKKQVELIAVSPDINDVLIQRGVDGVKEEIKKQGLEL